MRNNSRTLRPLASEASKRNRKANIRIDSKERRSARYFDNQQRSSGPDLERSDQRWLRHAMGDKRFVLSRPDSSAATAFESETEFSRFWKIIFEI